MSFNSAVLNALKVKTSTLESYDEDKVSNITDRINEELDKVLRDKEFQEEFYIIEEAREIVEDIIFSFDTGELELIEDLVEELEETIEELN